MTLRPSQTDSESARFSDTNPLDRRGASLLLAEGLSHCYGRKEAVRALSINLGSTEIIGLLGPNGAGKTTAMRLLAGLLPLRSGRVCLGAQDVSRLSLAGRARQGLGYLPQESSVFRRLTVRENIDLALQERGTPRAVRRQKIEAALDRLDLGGLASRVADTLSGGERRRLEIARALSMDPTLLLLDEPFAGLDPLAVERLSRHLTDLAKGGLGIILTDHNIRETLNLCHRATILLEGSVLREGTPRSIAQDLVVREHFLGVDFRLDS